MVTLTIVFCRPLLIHALWEIFISLLNWWDKYHYGWCILYIPITCRLFDHNQIQRVNALELMVRQLNRVRPKWYLKSTCRFSFLKENFEDHFIVLVDHASDYAHVVYLRQYALKTYFLFLVGTIIFVDKMRLMLKFILLSFNILRHIYKTCVALSSFSHFK